MKAYTYQKDNPCTETVNNSERILKEQADKNHYLEDNARSLTFAM